MNQLDEQAKELLARSLTAESTELLDFLPYLLQDLWALGGSPEMVVQLMRRHLPREGRFLDLACGKGAVAITVAKDTGWQGKGVDIIPEFIRDARLQSLIYSVSTLCEFEEGDVNKAVLEEKGYDLVIFSASGDILGPPHEMLPKLAGVVKPGGYILLDESYLKEGVTAEDIHYSYGYLPNSRWQELFLQNNIKEVACLRAEAAELEETNTEDIQHIETRARELAQRFPAQKALFEAYVNSQRSEIEDLENSLENVMWLLQVQ